MPNKILDPMPARSLHTGLPYAGLVPAGFAPLSRMLNGWRLPPRRGLPRFNKSPLERFALCLNFITFSLLLLGQIVYYRREKWLISNFTEDQHKPTTYLQEVGGLRLGCACPPLHRAATSHAPRF